MDKGSLKPELVNTTKGMSVPATEGSAYSIRPEGCLEYGKKTAGDMAANTRPMTPKLTHNQDNPKA